MKEYKVISDQSVQGTHHGLEQRLNELAREGFRVVECFRSAIENKVFIILEREK